PALAAARTAWSHGDHPGATALAATHGWRRARELWVMRRPATGLPPLPPAPDGVAVRGLGDGDATELLRVNAAAFSSHPEQGDLDADGLAERMAESWFDPAGLITAWDGDGRLLGFHWTKRHSPGLGEVYVVGIDPAAQGRGLGSWLTLAGLHHLADAGVEEIHLYVEADNDPAVHVYSRLGFAHAPADTHVQYARD
ncbi:MAG: mycothiol synthase, partial [Nocardioides sp.]|uniref:mycothiol synthase n=1 Tax=Nocardioides sp. TaxID=35761 RepID=UPI0039E532D1